MLLFYTYVTPGGEGTASAIPPAPAPVNVYPARGWWRARMGLLPRPPDDSNGAGSLPPRWERRDRRRRSCLRRDRRRPPIISTPAPSATREPPLRVFRLRRRPPIISTLFPTRGAPHSPAVLPHRALPAPVPPASPIIEPPNPYPPPRRLLRRFLRVCFLLRCIYLYLCEILLREQRRPRIVVLVLDALEPKDPTHRR